jgi:hypothetical protein
MALVEGFGDEVIQFFGILFIVALIVLLWMSTQVAEMQIFRGAVFILERRTRRRHHDTARVTPVIPVQSISMYIIIHYIMILLFYNKYFNLF